MFMSDGSARNVPGNGMDSTGSERGFREMHGNAYSLMLHFYPMHTKKEREPFRIPFPKQTLMEIT